jgi:hypothetical protein
VLDWAEPPHLACPIDRIADRSDHLLLQLANNLRVLRPFDIGG